MVLYFWPTKHQTSKKRTIFQPSHFIGRFATLHSHGFKQERITTPKRSFFFKVEHQADKIVNVSNAFPTLLFYVCRASKNESSFFTREESKESALSEISRVADDARFYFVSSPKC